MAQEWIKTWKAAKKYFEDTTGKKKPNAKVGSIFSKHSAGLDNVIKSVKDAFTTADAGISDKTLAAYNKAVDAYTKSSTEYIKVLDASISKEITDTGDKTVYSKSCKYLQKELIAIGAEMKQQIGWLEGKLKGESLAKVMADNLIKSIVTNVKLCQAAASKVKTKPTKDVFDNEIYTPARNLSQQIGNIEVLRKKGQTFPDKYDNQTAKALYEMIRPYGTEALKKKLPDDANAEQVLAELKKFTMTLKSCEAYANK
jgi:hypothetical protein